MCARWIGLYMAWNNLLENRVGDSTSSWHT